MRIPGSLLILFGMLVSVGCQPNPMEKYGASSGLELSPTVSPLPDAPAQVVATPDRMDESMTKMPERVPPTEALTPVTGEVPAKLLDSILKDLAGRTGAIPEKIAVIQAQAMVWNDGSLGCAKPGKMYTQALVNGYWVVLEVGEQKYDYRAEETGYFFLCARGLPPIQPPGTPSS